MIRYLNFSIKKFDARVWIVRQEIRKTGQKMCGAKEQLPDSRGNHIKPWLYAKYIQNGKHFNSLIYRHSSQTIADDRSKYE